MPAHLEIVPSQTGPTRGIQARTVRASAVRFSESVRAVVALARRGGLSTPVFRSPPGSPGVDRTIRWRGTKAPVVAIERSGRPLAAVQADIIEAVVVTNGLDDKRADRFRRAAWGELENHCLVGGVADAVIDLREPKSGEATIRVAS